MDRRQRKTREAIFSALIELLAEKDFTKITVGEIIERADVGRATFYSHFETKDFLLTALCEDLFCHIFDTETGTHGEHRHMFRCDPPQDVFLHLFRHLTENDNRILSLLTGQNTEIFLRCFKERLRETVAAHLEQFEGEKSAALPESFRIHHIASSFVETLRWWIENGRKETPETLTVYFLLSV